MRVDRRWKLATLAGLAAVTTLAATSTPAPEELAARRARIAAMDSSAQQALLRKLERFNALSPAEQQRLRELQAAITADPNSERLLLILDRYHEWLRTITPAQRAKLAELPTKQRVDQIAELRRSQRDAQRLEPLTWQDMRDIRRWIDELVERHRPQLVASIPERYRDWYNQQTDSSIKQMALVYRLFGSPRDGEAESKVTQDDLDRLTRRLSESARAELAKAGTLEEQRQLVRGWIFASLRRSSAWRDGRRNNPLVGEELLQFLQTEVPPAERERLLSKPREEMLQELRKLYFERSGGPPRGDFDGRFRGRPDGGRGERSTDRSPDRPPGPPRRPPRTEPAPSDAAPAASTPDSAPSADSAPPNSAAGS